VDEAEDMLLKFKRKEAEVRARRELCRKNLDAMRTEVDKVCEIGVVL